MPSQQSHTLTHKPTLMHTCVHADTKSTQTHTLAFLWTLLCTHHLYEAEDYPTIGNHNLPYMGLIQIHFGPFYNVYTMI